MNQRLEKARTVYGHWNDGDGNEGELAIALYDLTGDYEAILSDYDVLTTFADSITGLHNPVIRRGCPTCKAISALREHLK